MRRRKPVEFVAMWQGNFDNDDKKVQAPTDLYIADKKAWAKLWKAWRGEKAEVPEVNFEKQIILVVPTRYFETNIYARLDAKGELTVKGEDPKDLEFSRVVKKKGFSYQIVAIKREGIKTINGKALTRD